MAQCNWIWVRLNATTNGDPALFKTETNANDWLQSMGLCASCATKTMSDIYALQEEKYSNADLVALCPTCCANQ